MITFIKNSFFVASVTEEQYESNKEFYDTLERTEIVYERTLNFIKPKLENSVYIEGATVEEIEDYQDSFYPMKVTVLQFKTQLLVDGLKDDVENALNNLPEPDKSYALLKYEYATEFLRKDQLVQNLGTMIGLSKQGINYFFLNASKLE